MRGAVNMKHIFLLSIFGPNLFFSIMSILGLSYGGIEEGNLSYWIYLISLLLLSFTYFFVDVIRKKYLTLRELIYIYFFMVFFFIVGLYNTIHYSHIPDHILEQTILFIIFIIPSSLAGWYFTVNKEKIKYLVKNLEIIMLIFTIAIFITSFLTLINGNQFESFGGGTYQDASYISAFSFGINLFYLIWGEKLYRYNFFESNKYNFIQLFLLVIQLFSLIVGGGRGAFVLLIIYLLIYSSILIGQNDFKIILKTIFILMVFGISIYIFNIIILNNKTVVLTGLDRIFQFISIDGINWDGTSGRDTVYINILNIAKTNPVLGVGFFNYPLPHNLFLEVLVSTGIVGLFIFIIVLVCFIRKFYLILKTNFNNYVLLVIFLYPMVMLMFSSSLFKSTEFAFIMSYIFFCDRKSEKNEINNMKI